MQLLLLKSHEALAVRDGKDTVTVCPPCSGILTVDGKSFPIAAEKTPTPRVPGVIGYVKAVFTDERGIRYHIIHPHIKNEEPYSAVDFTKEYYNMIRKIDELDREVERLTQEVLDLRAQIQPDALGHLNIGGKEK